MNVHELPAAAGLAMSERVRRYVARLMSESECTEFETEMLASVELQDLVEAELVLREGAASAEVSGQELASRGYPRRPIWQLAAALLLTLTTGFLSGRFSAPDVPNAVDDQALQLIMFNAQRGPARTIQVPAGQRFVARILTPADRDYELRMIDGSGRVLHHWAVTRPEADGYITVLMPALRQTDEPLRVELLGDTNPQVFAIEVQQQ